jgi:hypothetical protein
MCFPFGRARARVCVVWCVWFGVHVCLFFFYFLFCSMCVRVCVRPCVRAHVCVARVCAYVRACVFFPIFCAGFLARAVRAYMISLGFFCRAHAHCSCLYDFLYFFRALTRAVMCCSFFFCALARAVFVFLFFCAR